MAASGKSKKFFSKDRFKQLWNGPNKGFYRYATVLTLVVVVYFLFLGHENIFRLMGAIKERRHQESEKIHYKIENARLDERIRRLSHEKDTLEEYARENFLFAAPGDDVFLTKD